MLCVDAGASPTVVAALAFEAALGTIAAAPKVIAARNRTRFMRAWFMRGRWQRRSPVKA